MLVKLVEHDLGLGAALELDDDAHAVAVALVAHVADFVNSLLIHQVGDALDELRLVDLVGNLGNDDRLLFLGDVFRGHAGTHHEAAPAGLVGVDDAAFAVEKAARGEIGALHVLEHFREACIGILHQVDGGVDHLGEIVRRNIRRHADGDSVGAVDDEIGNARGQDGRFLRGLVVIRHEVHGLHLDIGEQLAGDALHAALGVTHRGRRVAVDRAEVALAIDQRIAQRERLRHAHQRVVDGRVAVGMVDTHGLPHHLGALGVLLVVLKTHLAHGVEHAAMDGLETITGIGQRAPDDHRHRVIEIRATHLIFNVDGHVARIGRCSAIEGKLGVLIVCHRGFGPAVRRQKRSGKSRAGTTVS